MGIAENLSVILVRPWEPGNIGAAARAMKNMGLQRLVLVAPRDPLGDACRMMAVGAFHLVEQARICSSFDEAAEGEHHLVGTTSTRGRLGRVSIRPIREAAPLLAGLAETQRVGLVFGPERRGLPEDILARCQHLVTIPAASDSPVLNLAQAVLVVAYELFLADRPLAGRTLVPATQAEREQLFQHMQATLTRIGFLSRSNPGHIMRSLRRLLAAAELTPRDIRILRGIMSQMDWYAGEGRLLDPSQVVKP